MAYRMVALWLTGWWIITYGLVDLWPTGSWITGWWITVYEMVGLWLYGMVDFWLMK